MRKVPEIAFPLSIWPQFLVQAFAFSLYYFVLSTHGIFPEIGVRISSLIPVSGWTLPLVLWLVLILLLGELVIRKAQIWAANWSAGNWIGFRILTLLGFVLVFYSLFVLLECVLFWVLIGGFPQNLQPIPFTEGLWRTWLSDVPVMAVIATGEALRQLIYRDALRNWHHIKMLRKRVPHVNEDDMR
jgi:hypothetical protein